MKRLTLTLMTALTLGLALPAFSYPLDIPRLTYPAHPHCTPGAACRP